MLKYSQDDIKRWIANITPTLLYAKLPSTFEEYWKNIDTQARTEFRKAKKNGFVIKREINPPHKDIIDIWNSFTEKQGRPINKKYNDIRLIWFPIINKWPVEDYSQFNINSKTHMKFYSCFNSEGICKGFVETITDNKITAVHGTMAHKDSLKFGIMKFLFLTVIKEGIEQDHIEKFCYGDKTFLQDKRKYFINDLLIKEHSL